MNSTNFVQDIVSIKKGKNITLVADSIIPHTIANGTWDGGTAKPFRETGAPEVNSTQIGGNGQGTIGPFNTVGTFKLYCKEHAGMNLTVIVK